MKYGTSDLDRTLIRHNLIDEFHFSIFPVVVGRGRRLFENIDTSRLKLKLTGTTTSATVLSPSPMSPLRDLRRRGYERDGSDVARVGRPGAYSSPSTR